MVTVGPRGTPARPLRAGVDGTPAGPGIDGAVMSASLGRLVCVSPDPFAVTVKCRPAWRHHTAPGWRNVRLDATLQTGTDRRGQTMKANTGDRLAVAGGAAGNPARVGVVAGGTRGAPAPA